MITALYARIEYRWSLALSADLLPSTRYTRSPLLPFCIDVPYDQISRPRGYGLAWEWEDEGESRVSATGVWSGWSGDFPEFGSVIAPIGLNLVYAFWRWLGMQ